MKQNFNTRKLLYSLSAASAVLGAVVTSGCCQTRTRYIYLNADGSPYSPNFRSPTPTTTTTTYGSSNSRHVGGDVVSGILMGIGQGFSGL